MVAGVAITSGGGQSQYSGKMTPFVVLSCTMAAMGGVIFGYDIGISGGVTIMEPFLEKFFPEMYIKMKAFGRKPSILAGGAAFLAGAALGGVALNVYMLIFGRINQNSKGAHEFLKKL